MKPKIKYIPVEDTVKYNFSTLGRKIREELKGRFPEAGSEELRKLILKNLKKFSINGQTFEYTYRGNHMGGERWYVSCPKCGKPCINLYLPSHNESREQRYLCQNCHVLKNKSAIMGACTKYKKVVRPLKRLENIKHALMKKNITPERAEPLLDAYERIEKELERSPEYRLYKFQQEHKSESESQL